MPTVNIDLNNDPLMIETISKRTAAIFEERYANLLSCFEAGSVFNAIASMFRIDGKPMGSDFSVPTLLVATEDAFRKLLTRGALNSFQIIEPPIPEAAQRELDSLFGAGEEELAAETQAAQVTAHQAQVNQAAIDWRTLSSSDFKRKWMQTAEGRQIVEKCWAKIEADDRAQAKVWENQRKVRETEATQAMSSKTFSTRGF